MLRALTIIMTVCLILTPGLVQSGTIVLKNGHVINGKVIVSDDEKVIMSWGNGRTTIYHRFIESVSLTEEEKLAVRKYNTAKSDSVSREVTEAIQLPEFSELHGEVGVEVVANEDELDSGSSEDGTEFDEVATSSEVENFSIPLLEQRNFPRFGLSLNIPDSWTVQEFKDSLSIRSDCGGVLLALDRYQGGTLSAGRAAVGLQGMLNDQGFQQVQNGLSEFMGNLDAGIQVESLSPGQNHHSVHALVSHESGENQQLFSLYRSLSCQDETRHVLESVMESMEFVRLNP